MLTVSVFPSRECFMALTLSLFHKPTQGLKELGRLLRRSKNPPLSAQYTYELLSDKSTAAYGLDIVRFISQLADLSQGTSIVESVGMLKYAGLLSYIRHNLTHKNMPSDEMIQRGRQLILKYLRDHYWKAVYDQMIEESVYSIEKLNEEHLRIFGEPIMYMPYPESTLPISVYSLTKMNNYQFRHRVSPWLQTASPEEFRSSFKELSEFKKSIMLSQLLTMYSKSYKYQRLFDMIGMMIQPELMVKEDTLLQPYICRKFKKISLSRKLGKNQELLDILPGKLQEQLNKIFIKAQQVLMD